MKYCPYCGAVLPDGAVYFCMECGKAIPSEAAQTPVPQTADGITESPSRPDERMPEEQDKAESAVPSTKAVSRKTKRKAATKKDQRKGKSKKMREMPSSEKQDEGYDGYYDDVLPTDAGRLKEEMDQNLVRKIIVLVVSVLLIVGACVALMYLL